MIHTNNEVLKPSNKRYINLFYISIIFAISILSVSCTDNSTKKVDLTTPNTFVNITPVIDSLLEADNIDEAKKILNQRITDTTQATPDTIQFSYFFNKGRVLHACGKSDSAILCWNRAKIIAEDISRQDLIIEANLRLANAYSRLMQLDKAMETGLENVQIAKTYKPEKLRIIYEEQARIHFLLDQSSNKALDYLKKALSYSEKENDTVSYARLCFKISTVLQARTKYDSAEYYVDKAIEYYETNGLVKGNYANAYMAKGNIYADRKEFEEAIPFFFKALGIRKDALAAIRESDLSLSDSSVTVSDAKKGFGFIYFNIASNYNKMGINDSSIFYYKKALEEFGNMERSKENTYRQLAHNLYAIGNYKEAMEYFDAYMGIRKNAYEEKLELQINDLEEKYKSKEKEQKINELNKIMAFDRKVKMQQKVIIIILIALFVAVVLVAIFYFKQKMSVEKQEQVLLEQRLLRSQMNPHFILNTFTAIQYFIANNENKQANKYLVKFSRLLRLSLDNSISSFVAVQDEIEAVQHYLDLQIMRFDRSFDYKLQVYDNFEDDFVFIPPMLIQPFVENSIEHGFKGLDKGGVICLTINKKNNYLECLIEDNGQGRMNNITSQVKEKKSLSTQITSKRLDFLSRRLKTDASIELVDKNTEPSNESGLIVKLKVPYKSENYA